MDNGENILHSYSHCENCFDNEQKYLLKFKRSIKDTQFAIMFGRKLDFGKQHPGLW